MSPATVAAASAPTVPPTMPIVSAKEDDRRNGHGDEGADGQIESAADDDQGLAEGYEAKGGGAGE